MQITQILKKRLGNRWFTQKNPRALCQSVDSEGCENEFIRTWQRRLLRRYSIVASVPARMQRSAPHSHVRDSSFVLLWLPLQEQLRTISFLQQLPARVLPTSPIPPYLKLLQLRAAAWKEPGHLFLQQPGCGLLQYKLCSCCPIAGSCERDFGVPR